MDPCAAAFGRPSLVDRTCGAGQAPSRDSGRAEAHAPAPCTAPVGLASVMAGSVFFSSARSARRKGIAPLLRRWGVKRRGEALNRQHAARRSPLAPRRAAHRSPLSPAITHTWRCADGRDRRLRSACGSPPALSSSLPTSCTPQCAPGCVAHEHTQWALLMAGERHRSYRTAHARRAPTQRRHGGRFPARPRQPTAHNCMAHPAPHNTRQRHMHRHLRRPHRVALLAWTFALVSSGTAAHARIKHHMPYVRGRGLHWQARSCR